MSKLLAVLLAVSLVGCADLSAPITNQKGSVLSAIAPAGSKEAEDLLAAARNADGLVGIGVLAADDPIVTCSHGAVKAAGLDTPAVDVKSFTPEIVGPASAAVVAYARLKQAKGGTPIKVPAGCGDLLLQIKIDLIKDAAKLKLLP